jgi:hypothetical protein
MHQTHYIKAEAERLQVRYSGRPETLAVHKRCFEKIVLVDGNGIEELEKA